MPTVDEQPVRWRDVLGHTECPDNCRVLKFNISSRNHPDRYALSSAVRRAHRQNPTAPAIDPEPAAMPPHDHPAQLLAKPRRARVITERTPLLQSPISSLIVLQFARLSTIIQIAAAMMNDAVQTRSHVGNAKCALRPRM